MHMLFYGKASDMWVQKVLLLEVTMINKKNIIMARMVVIKVAGYP
jgi:hypothetical protein